MATLPIARIALSLSAIEQLAPQLPWSDASKEKLNAAIEATNASDDILPDERAALAQTLRTQHDFGASTGARVRALLKRVSIADEWSQLSKVYKIRSKLFHGSAVTKHDERTAANEARRIAMLVLRVSLEAAGASLDGL